MNYTKTTPCDLCPFRNDSKRLTVSSERLLEMAAGEFACHKTAPLVEDEENGSEYRPTEKSQHCAGALIFNEKRGMPHQMMRICERLGMYDASKLDMDAPVFEDENKVEEAEEVQPRKRQKAKV